MLNGGKANFSGVLALILGQTHSELHPRALPGKKREMQGFDPGCAISENLLGSLPNHLFEI